MIRASCSTTGWRRAISTFSTTTGCCTDATAFEVGHGIRHLQQCAVDRDEFHSRFRMLAKRLGEADWADELPGGALA